MRNRNLNFIVNLAALGVASALAGLFQYRSKANQAWQILQEYRLAAYNDKQAIQQAAQVKIDQAERKAALAQEQAALGERKADIALQQVDLLKAQIDKSSAFDFLSNIIDSYMQFLGSLDFIQLAAVVNIIIFIVLAQALFNILLLYFSDYYIEKFNLESRFPKLSRFLKARRLLVKGSLFFYSVCLLLILLYGLIVNIAIFFFA